MTTTRALGELELTDAEERRLALAAHEAGHAVVGVIHGAKIKRASVRVDGRDGQCSFTAASFGSRPQAYRTQIAAAGAVAAAVSQHGRRPTLQQIENNLHGSDREELRLAALAAGTVYTRSLRDVLPVVLRWWGPIGDLAAGLYVGDTITHADVCTVLGLADGGGPASFQLANLRAGLRTFARLQA